jgi:hypothetical protein
MGKAQDPRVEVVEKMKKLLERWAYSFEIPQPHVVETKYGKTVWYGWTVGNYSIALRIVGPESNFTFTLMKFGRTESILGDDIASQGLILGFFAAYMSRQERIEKGRGVSFQRIEFVEIERFESEDEAIDWMVAEVNDPCIDNHRVGYFDNPKSLKEYARLENEGCCGSFDHIVFIGKRRAKIGCNYGH